MPTATRKTTTEQVVSIPQLNVQFIEITLVGDSPLISHAWSQKAKKQMLDRQMKKASQAKEAKDPEQDFRDSLYYCEDGRPGFPAVAFKASAVDACSHVANLTKVEARGAFHIVGDMVAFAEGTPTMREDMVRVGMGTADIRYRGEYRTWRVKLQIRYNANMISPEQLANLFNVAGFAIGVGEWRPQRDGSFGMFHVQ